MLGWAVSQEPPYALHVGVHSGKLNKLVLRNGAEAYYGEPYDKLNVLERLPFTCSRVNDCYYLEPSSELPEEAPVSTAYESLSPSSGTRCTAEFRQMLVDHGIDISKFGKGQAKTLDELYRNVAIEKKSYFVNQNDTLERHMNLVNINLTVTSPVLAQDNKVTDKVERIKSMFFPGVDTMYTTHEVHIHIPDPKRPELKAIGLPDLTGFDTAAIPSANLPCATWSWRQRGEELSNEEALERLLQEHSSNEEI
eukprot:g30116.t1